MLAPAYVLLLVFNYAPLFGWVMAFTNYKIGQPLFGGAFTGLYQFKRIFKYTSDLKYLLRNTLVMNLGSIVFGAIFEVSFALLLKEFIWRRGAKIIQTVSFFPYFISWVITYSIVSSFFAVNTGLVNMLMVNNGIINRGVNYLGDPRYSWALMIGIRIWKGLGRGTIIYLAAISGIPTEQYESADIDGANRFQKNLHITIPHLLPTISVLFILDSGYIFTNSLDQYLIFTNTMNWERMEVLDMYIYRFGMSMLDYSYATAVGILKSVVSFILLITVNKIVKNLNETSLF